MAKVLGQNGLNKLVQLIKGLAGTSAPPSIAASGSVGTSAKYAREDHTHAYSSAITSAISNSHTHANKATLDGIASSDITNWNAAEENIIDAITVTYGSATANPSDSALTVTNKTVDIVIPTATSHLINDAGYVTSVNMPTASDSTPLKDGGTGNKGTSASYARGDHKHPSDYDKLDVAWFYASSSGSIVKYDSSSNEPNGAAATGVTLTQIKNVISKKIGMLAVGDDVYILPRYRADNVSGDLKFYKFNSGNVISVATVSQPASGSATATVSTVTIPTASSTAPLMDGTASYGSGTSYARSNHVHPSDITKVTGSVLIFDGSEVPNASVHKWDGVGISNALTAADIQTLIDNDELVFLVNTDSGRVYTYSETNTSANQDDIIFASAFIHETYSNNTSSYRPRIYYAAINRTSAKCYDDFINLPTYNELTTHTSNTTVHITAAERTAWNAKQNALTAGTDYLTPTQVDAAIDAKISSVYTPKGSTAFASLPSPASSNVGHVYNITDAFTTTSSFVEGAGKSYPAGTNVVCVNEGNNTYKWDVLAGFIDMTEFTTTEVQTIWDSVFNPGA